VKNELHYLLPSVVAPGNYEWKEGHYE